MATTTDGRGIHRHAVLMAITTFMLASLHQVATAQENGDGATDQAVCLKMIDEMSEQVHQYCRARNVRTLRCLSFAGSLENVSNATLREQLVENLTKRGLVIQDADSTHLRGKLVAQKTGTTSILMVQCVLSDVSGAELQTFRLRQVVGG